MRKGDGGKRQYLISHLAIGMCLAALVGFSVRGKASAQDTVGQLSRSADRMKKQILKAVEASPDISVSLENFEEVPVLFHEARVRQITDAEHVQLTGLTKGSPAYTTFPNVTLINKTDQRITGLTLMVGDRQTRKIHGVSFHRVSIEPHGTFFVTRSDWVKSEKTVEVSDSGKVTKHVKPGLDSEKMSFPAGATDLVLRVGAVEFENGQRWTIEGRSASW
jgi:hypothetical protein